MEVIDFIVAICAGFIGAICVTVFAESQSFKEFAGIFIISFIACSIAGLIFALLIENFSNFYAF